jgi:hypothetical protein
MYVTFLLLYPLFVCGLPVSVPQLLKNYDEMGFDLASSIEQILPFATHALEDVLYDETELLEGAIRKLHELITGTAGFLIGYAKQGATSTLTMLWCCSVIYHQVGRAAKSTISASDRQKIEALQRAFGKLKEDFDRAVDVAALDMARKQGEF